MSKPARLDSARANASKRNPMSTRYRDRDMESLSAADLENVAKTIDAGEVSQFNDNEIAALLCEKKLLDKGLSWIDISKILGFLSLFLSPFIV